MSGPRIATKTIDIVDIIDDNEVITYKIKKNYLGNRLAWKTYLNKDNQIHSPLVSHLALISAKTGENLEKEYVNCDKYAAAYIVYDLKGLGIIDEQYWYICGMKHRDNDLPAGIEYNSQGKVVGQFWYTNGKRYRKNGLPTAICYSDDGSTITAKHWFDENGDKFHEWYLDD